MTAMMSLYKYDVTDQVLYISCQISNEIGNTKLTFWGYFSFIMTLQNKHGHDLVCVQFIMNG